MTLMISALMILGDGEKRQCGKDLRKAIQEHKGKRGEEQTREHFKKKHPGRECHCDCHHQGGSTETGKHDKRKGNNGVGNGQDPQPPGKPPVNDGPGTRPGHPGRRGK